MTKRRAGIIYDIGRGKYGLALNSEQKLAFKQSGKVYMRVFTDILCQIPDQDPDSGKQYVSVKHITEIRQVGFQD